MAKTFEELGITHKIVKAITEIGYSFPMPIQEEVIPLLLKKKKNELIALAQTGTGKTAAFGIPILQQIQIKNIQLQAIILCPTRELCIQIALDMNDYSKYTNDIKILPIYGGTNIENQIRIIKQGIHIVVATPGRLIDLIHRHIINLQNIENIVLDEADEMLNMGFSEDIDEIFKYIPKKRNIFLFSATMPLEIKRIIKQYMNNPYEIIIGGKNKGAQNIYHIYFIINTSDKYLLLKRLVDYYPNIYGIIFCRTKRETQEISNLLTKDGYNADSLHGDLSQGQRDYVMNKFRIQHIQLLVATDVAARGLDVDNLSHIIHYGLPNKIESYIHRSGRTGRAGKTGTSIAIISLKDEKKIKFIEKSICKTFERGIIPSWEQICQKQLSFFIDKFKKVKINDKEIQKVLPSIYLKLENLDKKELINRLISNEFNRLIGYYQNTTDIKSPIKIRERISSQDKEYIRLYINLGTINGLSPKILIKLFNENIPMGKVKIGKINLMKKKSFFEIKKKDKKLIMQYLNGIKVLNKKVKIEKY